MMKSLTTKILVIGETCTDVFIYCNASRLSPEAPVPVLIPLNETKNDGMAGNVVQNIHAMFPEHFVYGVHQQENITKTRYIEQKSNHMFVRIDKGEEKIKKYEMTYADKETIKNADIVIVSDYDKGFLDLHLLQEIGGLAKCSILDSKKILTDDVVNSYTFVKVNELEYFRNKFTSTENIIITLGARGVMHKDIVYPSPKPQETIDVSGAGDTFTASFIVKYKETNDVGLSLEFANEMSSIVVSKRGVSTP